jgi:N-sulfoglucosamine sulfohydrolase
MPEKRPNVVLLIGEDSGHHLRCYGDPDALTPTLDGLAASGLRATRVYTHAPVCAPSRSGLVTGRYPYSFGTHQMRSTLLDPPPMFTRALKDAGYHVCWPSKTDFNFEMRDRDITDRREWWRDGLPEAPFFVYKNLFSSHESGMWPGNEEAAGARAQRLSPRERRDPASVRVPPWLPDTPEVRADIARHHENVTVVDHEVADLLRVIDAGGRADDTIVIFLVDHGSGIPRCKRWCYDGGLHMPVIVRWPGRIPPGSLHQGMVGYVDLAPQILAWCGVPRPDGLQGRVFHGTEATGSRSYAFSGRDRMDEQFDRIRSARSARYRYIRNFHPELPYAQRNRYMDRMPSMQAWRRLHAEGRLAAPQAAWFAREKPAEELYDGDADPWEMRNLAGDPAHAGALAAHRAALDAHLAEVGDLGATSEWELIRRGLVADRLTAEYRTAIEPLPAPFDNLGGPWDVDGTRWRG